MQIDRKYAKYAITTSIILLIIGGFLYVYLDDITLGFIVAIAFLYFGGVAIFQWMFPYYDIRKRIFPNSLRMWSFVWLIAGIALASWFFSIGFRVGLLVVYIATVVGEGWINVHSTTITAAATKPKAAVKQPTQSYSNKGHHKAKNRHK